MCFCLLFYTYVIVVRSILCLRDHWFRIFYILGFPGFTVIVILLLFLFLFYFIGSFPRPGVCLYPLGSVYVPLLWFSPGRESACILWFLFMFHFCGFPRPGDCLCLFCLWFALCLCNFVFDAPLVFFIGVLFWFWFIAFAGPKVCLFGFWGCFISFSGCCSSVLSDGCFVVFLSSMSLSFFSWYSVVKAVLSFLILLLYTFGRFYLFWGCFFVRVVVYGV